MAGMENLREELLGEGSDLPSLRPHIFRRPIRVPKLTGPTPEGTDLLRLASRDYLQLFLRNSRNYSEGIVPRL